MFGLTCGIITSVVGAVLVVGMSILGFVAVPVIIESVAEGSIIILQLYPYSYVHIIEGHTALTNIDKNAFNLFFWFEVTLKDNTIQLERFEVVPFPLRFSVRMWSITNEDEVMEGGTPNMRELGPYVYKMYQTREVEAIEDDQIHYRIVLRYEFDAEASYPHTEDDIVTVVNVPYHAILQVAETLFPALMPALSLGLSGVFGDNNKPILNLRVRDLLFEGIRICENPGIIGRVACTQIRQIGEEAQNLEVMDDGSLLFSLLAYRDGNPSPSYVVSRGLEDSATLAEILMFNSRPHLLNWMDTSDGGRGSGVCNMVNGTDSGIFAPFIDRDRSLWALNTDICRSVELRYQGDTEYEGIPTVRFSANEWFMDNHEGCFCLNVTSGITRDTGCLLEGAMELYTCVGAYLVLTYPHFLFAHSLYRHGVIGMSPIEDEHKIYLDIEPFSGTIVRGWKRAQFNVFMRPVTSIAATQNLRTTLTPIFWIEEGMELPEEFVDEIKMKLLRPLNIVSVLIPVLVAAAAVVLLVGLAVLVVAKRQSGPVASSTPNPSEGFPPSSETKTTPQ